MSKSKRLTLALRDDFDTARERSRLRRQRRSLARFSQCERNPEVVFLPHRLNLK